MRTSPIIAGILVLTTSVPASSAVRAADPTPTASRVDRAVFDEILKENVHAGNVDYLNIRRRHWRELRAHLDRLAQADIDALPRDEQLAFYINLYNATVVRAVIERFKMGYSVAENDFGVFKEPLVRLKGRTISLNDLENEIIRPRFKEPRIHVALVCGARSCPPLLPRAYRASDLDTVLDENMRRFVNDSDRNKIDPKRKRLRLSRIFEWYADDFGGKDALPSYVARYAGEDVVGFKVDFLEYSWRLNMAAAKDETWVVVTADETDLCSRPSEDSVVGPAKRNEVFFVLEEKNGWIHIERPFGTGLAWLRRQDVGAFSGPTD